MRASGAPAKPLQLASDAPGGEASQAAVGVALGDCLLPCAADHSVGLKESLRGNLWRSLDELGGCLVPVHSPFLGWPRV
jgi:hypothetical protein